MAILATESKVLNIEKLKGSIRPAIYVPIEVFEKNVSVVLSDSPFGGEHFEYQFTKDGETHIRSLTTTDDITDGDVMTIVLGEAKADHKWSFNGKDGVIAAGTQKLSLRPVDFVL